MLRSGTISVTIEEAYRIWRRKRERERERNAYLSTARTIGKRRRWMPATATEIGSDPNGRSKHSGLKIRSLSLPLPLQLQGFLQYRNNPNRSIIMNRTEPVKKYQYVDTQFKLRFVLVLFRLVVYNGERELEYFFIPCIANFLKRNGFFFFFLFVCSL